MKQFFRDNGGLLLLAAVLLAAVLWLASFLFNFNPLTGIIEVIATPLRSASSAVANWVQERYDRSFRYDELTAENEALRRQVAELQEAARVGEDAARENERLRDLLGLAEERPELQYRDAEVTLRSTSNWESELTIDRGTSSGVDEGDCVIDQYGNVVGSVTEAGLNWARVTTILDPDSELGGRVARTDEDAILAGDFTLMLEGALTLTYIPQEAQLVAGDQVITSGLGGVYPPGLLVGSVRSLYTEADGASRSAVVDPAADVNQVQFVFVIVDYHGEE